MTSRLTSLRTLRPAALAGLTGSALIVLLGSGYAVAQAVDGAPAGDTTAAPTASASPDGSSSGGTGGNSGSGTNAAVGVNGTDGKTVYAIKLRIVQTSADTVDTSNAAVAVNDGCTDCATVAIAFEGVLIAGSPSDFQPTNLALAANVDCSGCTAFADAYQKVVQSSTRVRITGAGRREVARIRQDLNTLRTSNLTLEDLRARVAADEQAFAAVLTNDVVPVGHSSEPAGAGSDLSDTPDATISPQSPTGATETTPTSSSQPSSPPTSDAPSVDQTQPAVTSTPSEPPAATTSPAPAPS